LRNESLRYITARKYDESSSCSPSKEKEAEEEEEAKLRVNLACDQYFLSVSSCMTDAVSAIAALLAM